MSTELDFHAFLRTQRQLDRIILAGTVYLGKTAGELSSDIRQSGGPLLTEAAVRMRRSRVTQDWRHWNRERESRHV